MPTYVYRCTEGHVTEDVIPRMDPKPMVDCKVCGQPSSRSYRDEAKNTDIIDNERWSESMGVTPEQVPEAMRTFPGSVYDSSGRLLIKNRKHKIQEMKRRGYAELD